jgi:choline dehydrogenase-like flavoprotein
VSAGRTRGISVYREILAGMEGLAIRESFVETGTMREMQVKANLVVPAARACESGRLLLNSKSTRHPNGFANSSGAVERACDRLHRR